MIVMVTKYWLGSSGFVVVEILVLKQMTEHNYWTFDTDKWFCILHFIFVRSPLSPEWSSRSWGHWRPSIGSINLRSQNIRDVSGHGAHTDFGPCPPVLRLAHLQRLLHQRVLGHQHPQVWVQVGANGHFTTIPVQSLD